MQQSSILLNSTDKFEVLEEIQNLNSRKSPSGIDISVDVFKHSKFFITSYIVRSFNKMLRKGEYSDIQELQK